MFGLTLRGLSRRIFRKYFLKVAKQSRSVTRPLHTYRDGGWGLHLYARRVPPSQCGFIQAPQNCLCWNRGFCPTVARNRSILRRMCMLQGTIRSAGAHGRLDASRMPAAGAHLRPAPVKTEHAARGVALGPVASGRASQLRPAKRLRGRRGRRKRPTAPKRPRMGRTTSRPRDDRGRGGGAARCQLAVG